MYHLPSMWIALVNLKIFAFLSQGLLSYVRWSTTYQEVSILLGQIRVLEKIPTLVKYELYYEEWINYLPLTTYHIYGLTRRLALGKKILPFFPGSSIVLSFLLPEDRMCLSMETSRPGSQNILEHSHLNKQEQTCLERVSPVWCCGSC